MKHRTVVTVTKQYNAAPQDNTSNTAVTATPNVTTQQQVTLVVTTQRGKQRRLLTHQHSATTQHGATVTVSQLGNTAQQRQRNTTDQRSTIETATQLGKTAQERQQNDWATQHNRGSNTTAQGMAGVFTTVGVFPLLPAELLNKWLSFLLFPEHHLNFKVVFVFICEGLFSCVGSRQMIPTLTPSLRVDV